MDAPVLRDIPLALPAPVLLLEILVVVSFLAHILFVALMVGGSLLTFALEFLGRRDPDRRRLAREVGKTITVNKSLAVVLGVAPLLILNTLYTVFFYSANALTGTAWILVVPLVIAAFLITYAHKYSWELLDSRRGLHLALAAASAALFASVPLIFLTNVNLMLYPEWWGRVRGFFSAMLLPNVLPRYLHFVTASVALTGIYMVWIAGWKGFPSSDFEGLDRKRIRRLFFGAGEMVGRRSCDVAPQQHTVVAAGIGYPFARSCGDVKAVPRVVGAQSLFVQWQRVAVHRPHTRGAPSLAIGSIEPCGLVRLPRPPQLVSSDPHRQRLVAVARAHLQRGRVDVAPQQILGQFKTDQRCI